MTNIMTRKEINPLLLESTDSQTLSRLYGDLTPELHDIVCQLIRWITASSDTCFDLLVPYRKQELPLRVLLPEDANGSLTALGVIYDLGPVDTELYCLQDLLNAEHPYGTLDLINGKLVFSSTLIPLFAEAFPAMLASTINSTARILAALEVMKP